MAEPHISPISAGEIPSAANVLANAFAQAPRFRFLLPDDKRRPPRLRWYWGATLRASVMTGAVVHVARRESGGDVGAVAIWEPPEQGERGVLTLARSGLWAAPIRLGVPAHLRRRALGRMLNALEPPDPCWYLDTIGVEPSEQGTGLGTALLDFTLERIDEEALPAFLDMSVPENPGYYERFGFRVTAESTLPNGIPLWGMTRRPRPG